MTVIVAGSVREITGANFNGLYLDSFRLNHSLKHWDTGGKKEPRNYTKPHEMSRPIRGFLVRVVSCDFVVKSFWCPNLIRFDLGLILVLCQLLSSPG